MPAPRAWACHAAGSVFAIDTLQRAEAEQVIKIARTQKQKAKAAQAGPQIAATTKSVVEELGQLKELLDCGALTDDEFTEAKKKLLCKV